MLEVYLLLQCNVVNLRVLANCCVWNYTPVEKHDQQVTLAEEFSDLRMLALFLFMRSIPPTWRLVMIMTSMTSLHLMHTASPCRLENVDPSILKNTTIAVPAPTLGDAPGREYIAEDDLKNNSPEARPGELKADSQPCSPPLVCAFDAVCTKMNKDVGRKYFFTQMCINHYRLQSGSLGHALLPNAVRDPRGVKQRGASISYRA